MGRRSPAPSVLVLCAAGAAQAVVFINHAPVLPILMRDLAVMPAAAGLLSTATFLGAGVTAVPIGRLTDRLGAKRVMTLSLMLFGVTTLALAAAPSYAALLLVRFVSGAGVTAMFVAGGHYVNAQWRGGLQFLAQGLYGGAQQFGTGAAMLLLPPVAARLGWRGALASCAVPVAIATAVWAACAPDRRSEARGQSIRLVLGNAVVWRLGLANAATFGLTILIGTWIAVYFVDEFRVSLSTAGALGSLSIILGMASRPGGGVLVARGLVAPRALIRVTLVGNALALALLALPQRPLGVAVIAVVMLGLASSLGYAAVVTLAGRAQPQGAGAALGLLGLCSTASVVLGAPLAGALLSLSGSFTLPLVVLAALPVAALWATAALPNA